MFLRAFATTRGAGFDPTILGARGRANTDKASGEETDLEMRFLHAFLPYDSLSLRPSLQTRRDASRGKPKSLRSLIADRSLNLTPLIDPAGTDFPELPLHAPSLTETAQFPDGIKTKLLKSEKCKVSNAKLGNQVVVTVRAVSSQSLTCNFSPASRRDGGCGRQLQTN